MNILVVDDAPEVLYLVRGLLESEGYQVTTAATGAQAVERLSKEAVDLILLDLDLPDTVGTLLCRDLRAQGVHQPILMLTAHNETSYRVEGLERGADDFIGKPFVPEELIARVRAHLRRTGLQADRAQALLRDRWLRIHKGLELAQKYQQPFADPPGLQRLTAAVKCFPIGRIGGDFHLLMDLDEHRSALLIGDAMGKGVSASLVMANTLSLLADLVQKESSPAAIMKRANRELRPDLEGLNVFVAAFCAFWDSRTGELRFCCAGHEPPLWLRGNQRYRRRHGRLSTDGLPLGAFDEGHYTERRIQPAPGDRIFCYTDGLTELLPWKEQPALFRRLYRQLLSTMHLDVHAQTEHLMGALRQSVERGMMLKDDMTFFIVEFP